MLPTEHGAWGFLFEPIVASIAIAPIARTVPAALLFVAAFLARQPLKTYLTLRAGGGGRVDPGPALGLAVLFGSLAGLCAFGTALAGGWLAMIPLMLAAPFGAFQIYRDTKRMGRTLGSELAGAVAISSSSAVILLTGGSGAGFAAALWATILARLIPSTLYIRGRLRLEKGKESKSLMPVAAHVAAAALSIALAAFGPGSWLTVIVFVVLLGRCWLGLSRYRKPTKAMILGVRETIYGLATVLSIIIGYYLGI